MKRLLIFILLVCLLGLAGCAPEQPGRPNGHQENFAYLEDPTGQMKIEQAAESAFAGRYRPHSGPSISLGFCRSALWIRLPMSQAWGAGPWKLEINAPWLDMVDMYTPRPDGKWLHRASGLRQPWRGTIGRSYLFYLPADTPRNGFLYLRVRSELALNLSLRLWPQRQFVEHITVDSTIYGLLYGVIAAMVIFNLMVFLSTRRRAYRMYVLYLISIILHQACLQGQILFAPLWVWPWVPHISLLASAALFYFGAGFCRAFLRTRTNAPLMNRLLKLLQAASLLLGAFGVAGQIWLGTWLVHSLALVGPVLALVAGASALARGFRPARFYLVAWFVLLLSCIGWGAWTMGWLRGIQVPQIGVIVAVALEAALLTLALADWVRSLERERELLVHRERRYHHLSITDELSGLYNARYFWTRLASEVDRAHSLHRPLSLVLLDLDDFKLFNDTYGHPEGDKVVAEVGRVLRQGVRPADTPCRYGGEEFALILPGAFLESAGEVAERVRQTMGGVVFRPTGDAEVTVTTSLGVAQLQPGQEGRELVEKADAALYTAKRRGKNCVVFSENL